jgi:hypothetical protein
MTTYLNCTIYVNDSIIKWFYLKLVGLYLKLHFHCMHSTIPLVQICFLENPDTLVFEDSRPKYRSCGLQDCLYITHCGIS